MFWSETEIPLLNSAERCGQVTQLAVPAECASPRLFVGAIFSRQTDEYKSDGKIGASFIFSFLPHLKRNEID
jgi:hypothetical protein